MADDYLVIGPDGRQMLKSQYDAENQRAFNTSRLNSLLSAPVAAGAYGVMDQAGVNPAIRDSVTGGLAGFEGIAQGALGARGGMNSESMLNAPPKMQVQRNPGPSAVPPRSDYGLSREGWQEAAHATPFKFNKFDMDKIGTGEGAAMPEFIGEKGHGMYLSNRPTTTAAYMGSIRAGHKEKTGEEPTMVNKRVAIPNNDQLLNLDKNRVGDQPPAVQEKIQKLFAPEPTAGMDVLLNRLGGQSAYTSAALEKAGIPGLRYDGYMQKKAGYGGDDGQSNFVMWDTSKMRPLRHDLPWRTPIASGPHRSTTADDIAKRMPSAETRYDPDLDGPDEPQATPPEKWPAFNAFLKSEIAKNKAAAAPSNLGGYQAQKEAFSSGAADPFAYAKAVKANPDLSFPEWLKQMGNKAQKAGMIVPQTATTALKPNAPDNSSPWTADTATYKAFMASGLAPQTGVKETEDAWDYWIKDPTQKASWLK